MSATSVFTPPIDEGRWVRQGARAIQPENIIDIDFPPTIFQVPKALIEAKPEVYTPQRLGLGPYHHLRPELHATSKQKLTLVKKFQKENIFMKKDLYQALVKKMEDLEPVVRANYDKYLDLECSTLVYIILIDSLYLFDFLGTYNEKTDTADLQPGRRELAKDVIMLENQIPTCTLVGMRRVIGEYTLRTEDTMIHSQLFYYFCKAHSPLILAERWIHRCTRNSHLLAHMYHLIINNRTFTAAGGTASIGKTSVFVETGTEILKALNQIGLGGPTIKPLLFAFKAVEVLENSMLTKEISISKNKKEQKVKPQKIHIPSVSELSKKHKVEFKLLEREEGIMDIKFDLETTRTLYLPEITMKYDSEVVLRNLVAYEAAVATPESTFELAEYADLMVGILHTPKDVAMLRERGIVKGNLDDEQVAEIFNGISKSLGKSKKESASQKVVKQVKEMVVTWENNQKLWKRLHRSLDKNVKIMVEVMKKPSPTALKYLLYIFMALLLVLQIMQAYCQVYGCKKGGDSKSN